MNTYANFDFNNDEVHQETTAPLLIQSKRITKGDKNFQKSSAFEDDICKKAPKPTSGRKGAKYDTFDSEEQEQVMAMLRGEVKGLCEDDQDWHNALVSLPAKQYRPILASVIPRLRPAFKNADKTQMNQMWKKIKNLVVKKSQGTSEKRGEPIILDHELPYFKKQVHAIIKTLRNKSFEAFRKKLLPVIEHIRTQGGRPFNANVFKKHKWSEFVNDPANADIKAAWKKLPRASNNADDSDVDEEDHFSSNFESCENTTMASSGEMSPINSLETPQEGMMGVVVESYLPVDSDQADFPPFEDGFGCVTDVSAFLSSQSEVAENNFGFLFEAPIHEGCPGYDNDIEKYFANDMKVEKVKYLLEDDNTYKQAVFAGMSNGTYQWDL